MKHKQTFALFEELKAIEERLVREEDHVLGEVLEERQEAALGVEPGLGAELLLHGLKALDHSRDAELVVPWRPIPIPIR